MGIRERSVYKDIMSNTDDGMDSLFSIETGAIIIEWKNPDHQR